MPELVRPTAVACLPAGRVEYRLERRGEAVVMAVHLADASRGGRLHGSLHAFWRRRCVLEAALVV